MRRLVAAKDNGSPAHALVPDEANLDLRSLGLGDDRGYARLDEANRVDPPVWALDVFFERQFRGPQVRLQ